MTDNSWEVSIYDTFIKSDGAGMGTSRGFALIKSPEDFPHKVAGWTQGCFAWSLGSNMPTTAWWFSSSYNIGGYHFMTKEWWEQYANTYGRFIVENYPNYFAPLLEGIKQHHTFVDVGLKYPVLIFRGNANNKHKAHAYPVRSMGEYMALPRDVSYEDFITLSSGYMYGATQPRFGWGGETFPFHKLYKDASEVGSSVPLERWFNAYTARVVAKHLANDSSGSAFTNAVNRVTGGYAFDEFSMDKGREFTVKLSKKYDLTNGRASYSASPLSSLKGKEYLAHGYA